MVGQGLSGDDGVTCLLEVLVVETSLGSDCRIESSRRRRRCHVDVNDAIADADAGTEFTKKEKNRFHS